MGLLDKLLHRDWKYYLNRCDKMCKNLDFGDAMMSIRKAKDLAGDDADAQKQISEKEDNLKGIIYKRAYDQAKQYLRSGQQDAAKNAIERAARYVRNDEERDALNALVDDSNHWQEEEKIVEPKVEGEERVSNLDTNDKWNLYVTSLPFDKAQHCDELGDDFKKAWIALQEGAFDEAIEGIEAVYKDHADDALVMCELGRAYYGKGRLDDAARLLIKSDEADANIETKLLLVEIYWAMKKFSEAEEVLQAAHDMDSENIQVLARIAQHGLISHDYESGIAAVEVLLEQLPKDISVIRLAGRLYQANDEEDKALECYENVNHLYWQMNPQTHKLTFDQNSAAAAAEIYFKRGEKLDRCVELYEALRANTDGETHIAICMKLSEVFEKMDRKSKRAEVLNEALRFMDEMLDKLRGPERAMLQLQYSEISEKLGDTDKVNEMLDSARKFFEADKEKGQLLAEVYVDMIDRKKAGEPFPTNEEMQKRVEDFVNSHQDEIRRHLQSQQPSGEKLMSTMDDAPEEEVDEEAMKEAREAMAKAEEQARYALEHADDILRKMAAGGSSKAAPKKESSEEQKATQNNQADDILRKMASMASMPTITLSTASELDDDDEADEASSSDEATDTSNASSDED